MVGNAVTATTAGLPGEAAPASYEQLAAEYGGLMRSLVRRKLGPRARPEDAEDVFQYILKMIMPDAKAEPPRPGILAEYNPGYEQDTGSRGGFRPLLCRKVELYCRGKREELARREGREWLIIDAGDDPDKSPWVERFGGAWDDYPGLDDGEAWRRMLDHLATVPARPGHGPLGPLLEHAARVAADGGQVSAEGVRRAFGLTRREAGDYLSDLRVALGGLNLGRDEIAYELGGMTLAPSELLAHVDALRNRPGHHVVAIWRRAGLKLKDAGRTWYLPLAAEEMRLHPESRQASGSNVPGGRASPVKYALIRALERLLTAEATSAVPPPPAVRRKPRPKSRPKPPDLGPVEEALRALPGITGQQLDEVLAHARGVLGEAP